MFPYSPSTAHESAVCSSERPRPFCASSMIRRPPGCTHQKSTATKVFRGKGVRVRSWFDQGYFPKEATERRLFGERG